MENAVEEQTGTVVTPNEHFLLMYCLHNPDFWGRFGEAVTFLTMVPAGILSTLLADEFLQSTTPIVRIILDVFFGATSLLGKYALIHFFNADSFRNLANLDWYHWITDGDTWSFKALIGDLIALVVASVFAYLAWVSLILIAGLGREYDTASGRLFAMVIESEPMIWIMVLASFGSNLFSFANIVPSSYHTTKSWLLSLLVDCETQEDYLKRCRALVNKQNGIIDAFNQAIISSQSTVESVHDEVLLQTMKFFLDDTLNPDQSIQMYFDNPITKQKIHDLALIQGSDELHRLTRYYLANLGGLLIAGVTIAGFSNFYLIAQDMAQKAHFGSASPIIGVLNMIGMGLLGMLTIHYRLFILSIIEPDLYKHEICLLSQYRYRTIQIISTIICVFGGTANTYQALRIADQNLSLVIAAQLAPCFIEYEGTIALFSKGPERVVIQALSPELVACHQLVKDVSQVAIVPPNCWARFHPAREPLPMNDGDTHSHSLESVYGGEKTCSV
jgi:hypothetical protein